MFTGLVEEIGIVKNLAMSGTGKELIINCNKILKDINIGDSISINGVCQTVAEFSDTSFTVFISDVSLSLTNLGNLKSGEKVNLERAMQANNRFGGHIVQGHVDGVGKVDKIVQDASGILVNIKADYKILKYLVNKGSVTINGVSLTVVEVDEEKFTLYLIPETIKSTTLSIIKNNELVNIEVDILSKYVEKMLLLNNNLNKKDDLLKKKIIEGGF